MDPLASGSKLHAVPAKKSMRHRVVARTNASLYPLILAAVQSQARRDPSNVALNFKLKRVEAPGGQSPASKYPCVRAQGASSLTSEVLPELSDVYEF